MTSFINLKRMFLFCFPSNKNNEKKIQTTSVKKNLSEKNMSEGQKFLISFILTHHTLRRYVNKPPTDSHCWLRAPPDVTYRKREIIT